MLKDTCNRSVSVSGSIRPKTNRVWCERGKSGQARKTTGRKSWCDGEEPKDTVHFLQTGKRDNKESYQQTSAPFISLLEDLRRRSTRLLHDENEFPCKGLCYIVGLQHMKEPTWKPAGWVVLTFLPCGFCGVCYKGNICKTATKNPRDPLARGSLLLGVLFPQGSRFIAAVQCFCWVWILLFF